MACGKLRSTAFRWDGLEGGGPLQRAGQGPDSSAYTASDRDHYANCNPPAAANSQNDPHAVPYADTCPIGYTTADQHPQTIANARTDGYPLAIDHANAHAHAHAELYAASDRYTLADTDVK
jgi:hypothetical protein